MNKLEAEITKEKERNRKLKHNLVAAEESSAEHEAQVSTLSHQVAALQVCHDIHHSHANIMLICTRYPN